MERAIRNGIKKGVSDAIGGAIKQAVEPAAANLANKAAGHIDDAVKSVSNAQVQTQAQKQQAANALGGAFANLERATMSYATEAAKNMKICPSCEKPTTADKTFCPECGARLPEQTVAQGALCPACGKQNSIGTKFCQDCGTKLPMAVAEEARKKCNADVMLEWEKKLSQYPKWACGGNELYIEESDGGFMFIADFGGDTQSAHRAVEEYRQILLQAGFRQAGQYPTVEQLFKRVDGIVYNVDTEHCFEGDPDCACIGFCTREPYGGFDYVKKDPPKKVSLRDLFNI